MTLSPKRLSLYNKIAWLFIRHARSAIEEQTSQPPQSQSNSQEDKEAQDFVNRLESMGPTFVKLGQLLSTRSDLFPKRYTDALQRLQDDVNPLEFEIIKETIESELDTRCSKLFANLEEKPMASASLGQVHAATLRDGRSVVVKIQRPDVGEKILEELSALSSIAAYADEHTDAGKRFGFSAIIEQFRRSLLDELDYALEARNLREMGQTLKDFPLIVIPQPLDGLCTRRVLVMERVEGAKVTEISGVAKTELDGSGLAEEVFRAYLHQVLIRGFYHGDPHPGNVLLTPEKKIALIDLGMVGRLGETLKDTLFGLLTAISSNEGDNVAEIAERLAELRNPDFSRTSFVAEITDLVGRAQGTDVRSLQFGSIVMEVMRICADHGLVIPREISMLGKTLLNLDKIGMALDPEFDPNESIRRNLSEMAQQRTWDTLKRGSLMSGLLEAKEFVTKTPRRLNDILSIIAENRLRLDVDAIDEKQLIRGFQKIANRIANGAVIGSLIIGASFMMDIDSNFQIWGYPGLPMLLLILSGLLGFSFALSVLKNDE